MAASSPLDLQDEASCPICLETFQDPVITECGHNFCEACISRCWEESDTDISCPRCRETVQQRNLRPNRQLANILEIIKGLSLKAEKGSGEGRECEEHQEPLKLFCEEDQTPICVVCDRSQAHRAHAVVPIEEAAQEYKVGNHCPTQRAIGEWDKPTNRPRAEDRGAMAPFSLGPMASQQKGAVLPSCWEASGSRQEGIQADPGKKAAAATLSLRTYLLILTLCFPLFPVNVTLDPDTAHPELLLFEDQRSVRWGDKWHRLPDNPKRFDTVECVLGCEGFKSGRYCWEVEVEGEIIWAVGVARESVRRKGLICFNPEWGIWAVEQWWGEFQALTSPRTPLLLSWIPRRIRVYLDYEQGLVTFLDADNDAPIFTFPPASFRGEKIYPWLWVQSAGSQLRLCP
uniref:Zinc finger protein RFP-like n=1 Tax=Pelusios castaneus TaxID=367368 RepID=A0A8C8VFF3_9SAUR